MRAATSATELTRHRPGFGWTVRPAPGSILASTRVANWDPEPDYFHHWIRDSAIVLRAVPLAILADPGARSFWLQACRDFILFSLHISDPARRVPPSNPLRNSTRGSHLKFLRPDFEFAALTGDAWLEEPRVAPDGTPDPEQWGRPQDDGPALRASAMMALLDALPELGSPEAEALIDRDLAHSARIGGRPCIGPWEEWPPRRTSFTLLAQWDALDRGATRAARRNTSHSYFRGAADRVAALIQQTRTAQGGWLESLEAPDDRFDSATVLAILHAGRHDGSFALTSSDTRATVSHLETIFANLYPINNGRDVPAIGRWAEDVYFDGNPWYPTTLGFADLHYRIAALTTDRAAFAKAEAWMALIEEVAPAPAGALPEQFDRNTGVPVSNLDLTWSAAAFLEAAASRDTALQAMAGSM